MKKLVPGLVLLIIILTVGCGRDLVQARRYSNMKSESDSLINLTNLIINAQKIMLDSLRKIRDDLMVKSQKNNLSVIDRKITNAVEIESNFENVRKHLQTIKKFAEDAEKATHKIIFYKRKYITYAAVIQIHDENVMIQEITDGLSAKQYITKYLAKEKK
jgi:hypothetical protein